MTADGRSEGKRLTAVALVLYAQALFLEEPQMTRLKSSLFLCAALLALFSAAPLFAESGITGKWTTTDMKMPDGTAFTLTFEFKQDGTKLTGTITGPQGDPLAIDNGKIDGDKFSFTVSFNGMTITHDGTVNGDDMKMSTKSDGGMPPMEMTLKRVSDTPNANTPKQVLR